ncbi:hypothetical protein GCM10010329_27540 [Streptomyces spiroverticillatus]|uniref:Uncharacterized protein n=1 Tax=Streptomyces finlayi TaxID=67296 RepID=A0A918WVN0_9ACTN|nr:hypothetical protein [Streptomyces finlayi]GHA03644.1 hypothetical protein GCM10010329_27540 [Streptomyces spiroverticillatus]GHC87785.1 hypothetical protein GCM10010334_19950 [Streptomyces finlayi]
MGTSSRWEGPRWKGLYQRLATWDPERSDPGATAAAAIDALHDACQQDPDAFGLQDAASAAGARLSDAMQVLAESGPSGLLDKIPPDGDLEPYGAEEPRPEWPDPADAFVAELTRRVAGDGTTVVDSALRRAVAASAGRLLAVHPEVRETLHAPSGPPAGAGLASDLLCLLYRWFFADLITEFLRTVIAEKIKLAVPVLLATDPEGQISDFVADRILALIPNPCEEAAEDSVAEAVPPTEEGEPPESITPAPSAENPLSEVARRLVPGTVGKILGLAIDTLGEEEPPA